MVQPSTQRINAPNDLPALARVAKDQLVPSGRPLRILVFSKSKKHTRVPVHFIRGFEQNGHQVFWLRTRKLNRTLGSSLAQSYMRWRYRTFKPDLVFTYCRDIPLDVLTAVGEHVPKIVFYEDMPGDFNELITGTSMEVFQRSSVVFTTARDLVPFFKERGVSDAQFLHAGCDPVDHFREEPDPRYASEVAFIGRAIGDDRLRLMRQLADNFDLRVYGRDWKEAIGIAPTKEHVFPEQYRKVCSSSKIVIGIDLRHDVELYFSNRTWLTMGCGGFLLARYVPSLEEFFTNHQHMVWYKSLDECVELIRYYLEHEEERRKIALAGYEYVHKYHTFRHATATMVDVGRSLMR